MSVIHGVNYGTPTLDLNFAKNKSLIDTVTGRNLVTFTRASTGTYVGADGLIKTAVANEARFDHNPATGESLGLLVEEARTNFLTYSTVISAATWNVGASTVLVPNATLAPDGTFTATKCTISSTATLDTRFQLTRSSGTAWSASTFVFFAKKAEARYLIAGYQNYGGYYHSYFFDFDTGTVSGYAHPVYGTLSASMTSFPNGWFRCSMSVSVDAAAHVYLYPTNTGGSPSDGISGVFLWGTQTEAGAFPTSYIPTTGSTVTRSADSASITGTNFSSWYNQNEGSLFWRGSTVYSVFNDEAVAWRLMYQGATSEQGVWIAVQNPDSGSATYLRGTTGPGILFANTSSRSYDTRSIAVGYSSAGVSLSERGDIVTSSTQTFRSNTTYLEIGGGVPWNQYQYLNGRIARLTYYPTRLQDFQLRQLTK